jgi:hypothetical protein
MPTFHDGYQTQSSGVHITSIAPGLAGHIPRLTYFKYRAAATAHTMYVMKCCGNTAAGEEASSGVATLEFDDTSPLITAAGADETVAASDWCVYKTVSGLQANDIASLAGNVVSFNDNHNDVVEKGAPIWVFGELTRAVHTSYELQASQESEYPDLVVQGGIAAESDRYQARAGSGEPLLLVVDNATNPGFLQSVSGIYVPDSDQNMN